jgi:predicted alpha/beta superfamily hydrolase
MKLLTIFLAFISVSLFGQKIETETIPSKVLDQERKVWIYTPWQYEEYPDKKLETIYVFDAQNREYFDLVHSTLQFLGGEEFAFIVVGIESPIIEEKNQSRNTDFLPRATHAETIEKYGKYSGGADKFLGFVETEVIPFMDKHYRTLPERVAVGHSNGGTFISYALLKAPDLFDAFIAISPNFAYDKGQLVNCFKELNPADLETEKFIFISNSNENEEISDRWKGWSETRKEVRELLMNEKFNSKIHLETRDFSATENHSSSFPIGAFNGLKSFIEYQFRTGKNVISYYERLARQDLITLDPDRVNTLAYECFWNDRTKEALVVIDWAINKFPKENNLYDSQGEFYEKLGDLENAKRSYEIAIRVLSERKGEMGKTEYDETMDYYNASIQRIKN